MLLGRLAMPPMKTLRRLAAAAAGLLFFFTAAALVVAGSAERPLAPQDAQFVATRLVEVDQSVRTRLVRLAPAGGVALARRHTREGIAQLRSLGRFVQTADGARAARLRTAIAAELRFLDAVGSVLSNPRSPLLARLERLDADARAALAATDGPRARRVGGVTALKRRWGGRAVAGP